MIQPDYTARISDLAFIAREDAAWLAVSCVLVAEGCNVHFDDFYGGMLADRFIAWASKNRQSMSIEKQAECLVHVFQVERKRKYAREVLHKHDLVLAEDVNPLGLVLAAIWKGATKESAMCEASSFNDFLRKTSDPEQLQKWPKSFRAMSQRSLEKRWSVYQRVLPYILIFYLHTRALHEGHEGPVVEDIPHVSLELQRRLYTQAKTRPPSIKPWKILELV